jgi:3-oxoacyl-[acyl-carrier-protein] synthase-3
MGAVIRSAVAEQSRIPRGYLHTGTRAVKACMDKAGLRYGLPGLMINTGIFTDKHVQEPSFASLLQGRGQKGRGDTLHGTFSFDLHSGGGGFLPAIQIIDGFLDSGKVENGMVVAGDYIHRSEVHEHYRYRSHGAAVFLEKGEPGEGFVRFDQHAYTRYMNTYKSYTKNINGALKTIIDQSDKYLESCIDCAARSIGAFLEEGELSWDQLDLVITSQDPPGFTAKLHELLPGNRIIVVKGNRRLYTAGVVFALEQAISSGLFSGSEKILFLTVGAGITVNLALYKKQ